MDLANRRDPFCGKLSLARFCAKTAIRYSLTKLHTCAVTSAELKATSHGLQGLCSLWADSSKRLSV